MANGAPPLNQQIVDAVRQSTKFAFGTDVQGSAQVPAGAAIAYEKAAQACALAIQDATDYERNIMSISTAAQGKALALMLSDPNPEDDIRYAVVFALAVVGSLAAAYTAGIVGTQATATLNSFPSG